MWKRSEPHSLTENERGVDDGGDRCRGSSAIAPVRLHKRNRPFFKHNKIRQSGSFSRARRAICLKCVRGVLTLRLALGISFPTAS